MTCWARGFPTRLEPWAGRAIGKRGRPLVEALAHSRCPAPTPRGGSDRRVLPWPSGACRPPSSWWSRRPASSPAAARPYHRAWGGGRRRWGHALVLCRLTWGYQASRPALVPRAGWQWLSTCSFCSEGFWKSSQPLTYILTVSWTLPYFCCSVAQSCPTLCNPMCMSVNNFKLIHFFLSLCVYTHTHTHTHTHLFGLPWWFSGKESTCQCRRLRRHGLGRFPRGGNGNLLQYFCLESPMNRGAWWATAHRVARVGHDWVTKHSTYTYLKIWILNLNSLKCKFKKFNVKII